MMKKLARVVLGLLIVGIAVATWMVAVDEDVSRDEDDWRKGTSPSFQRDFPPGHAAKGAKR